MPSPDSFTPLETAPVVETARLRLRGARLSDFPASMAMWSDPDVVRYISGKPFREPEVWARLQRYVGHWALFGYGQWVAEEKETGRFVGEIGFFDARREIPLPFHGTPELGWVVAPSAQGKGYATEALRASIAWMGRRMPGARTVCMIAPENGPSLRVAEKIGYREYARSTHQGFSSILFERTLGE